MKTSVTTWKRELVGDALGAFVLVLFGCGSVAVAVLFNAHQGLMQLALAWVAKKQEMA